MDSLDTIRKNLVAFFADLVEFFRRVFNFFVNGMNSLPGTTGSDATGSDATGTNA